MTEISQNMKDFLLKEARERFLKYVQIDTASDEHSGVHPSTENQLDLARVLQKELQELKLMNVELDSTGYVYAVLPASEKITARPVTFCSHMDTSPAESGKHVNPLIHINYDGGDIRYPDDPELILSAKDSPDLSFYTGQSIITASGKTLLGADDKAGVAEDRKSVV